MMWDDCTETVYDKCATLFDFMFTAHGSFIISQGEAESDDKYRATIYTRTVHE